MELRAAIDLIVKQDGNLCLPERIIQTVCEVCGVTRSDVLGRRRVEQHAFARQIAMTLIRERSGLSFRQVGQIFGGKASCTVIYASRRVAERKSVCGKEARIIAAIEAALDKVAQSDAASHGGDSAGYANADAVGKSLMPSGISGRRDDGNHQTTEKRTFITPQRRLA